MTQPFSLDAGLYWLVTGGLAQVADTPCKVGWPGGRSPRIRGVHLTAEARRCLRAHCYDYDRTQHCWVRDDTQ